MQPIVGRINQLTDRPSPPTGGSGVPAQFGGAITPFALDTSQLDEAQKKADKLKATLLEVQELIRKTNVEGINLGDKIINGVTKEINRAIEYSWLVSGKHHYGGN